MGNYQAKKMINNLGLILIFVPSLTSFLMFIANGFLRLPLSTFMVVIFMALSIGIIKPLLTPLRFKKYSLKSFSGLELALVLGICLFLLLNYLFNWYWPPTEFDALSMYDFRGRIFFLHHNIQGISDGYHASYPLFTSLSHTAMYFLGFEQPKLFYSVMLTGTILIFYSYLRRRQSRYVSLLGALLLITTPAVFYHSQIAYTNFVYLSFLGLSFIYLSELLTSISVRDLAIFSLLFASASWTRPATHPYFLVNLLPLLYIAIRQRRAIIALLPLVVYLLFSLPWQYYQQFVLQVGTYESSSFAKLPTILNNFIPSLSEAFQALKVNLTSLNYSGGVGILFLVAVLAQMLTSYKKLFQPVFLILLINLGLWIVLSVAIQTEFDTHEVWIRMLYDSMQRLFIIYFPIIITATLSLPVTSVLLRKINQTLK